MEEVKLCKDTIQELAQELGSCLLFPHIPFEHPSIRRAMIVFPFGIAVNAVPGNSAHFQPIAGFVTDLEKRLYYTGYKAHASFKTGVAHGWLVEVSEDIAGTTQAILAAETHLPPEEILKIYTGMGEANKFVRTIASLDDDDTTAWSLLNAAAGLLDSGHTLALFLTASQLTTGTIHGVFTGREYVS